MQIEDLKMKTSNLEIKNIYRTVNPETCDKYVSEFNSLLNDEITNKHQFTKIKKELSKKYSINPSVATMNYSYYKLFQKGDLERNNLFEMFNVTKLCRTNSGITQITVMSSPYPNGKEFSCEHNCYYCPNEPAHGYTKIAVISGVGVRKYYEKFGYKFNNNYMIKNLYWKIARPFILAILIVFLFIFSWFNYIINNFLTNINICLMG